MKSNVKPVEHVVTAIEELDLDQIKYKLMDREEGQGWTREQADHYELEYKRYLMLLAKYPSEVMAPDKNVDKFWHAHILDTLKYAEDCDNTFGYFLHHVPYIETGRAEDAFNFATSANNMARLYQKEFGQMKHAESGYCGAMHASYCGASTASYCGALTEIQDGPNLNPDLLLAHIRPALPAL